VTVLAGATTFSFGSVPSGTAYTVTVTQPTSPSQTCVVTNGTGTVTTANVGNIAVACTTNSYTLGGTVSGLTGSGLVLSSAGLTPVTVLAGATTFSFGSVPSGTTYNVTATAQPASPTQNCVVANGIGTVTGANIANITVTCTTSSYTLGGTVSGLTGTGLVLSSTGLTPVTVTAGATTFSFGSVPSGTAYNVTVIQPTVPSQTCIVTNGTGTVTTANVGNIAVACTTNSYTLGGTVSGLTGTGLVLSSTGRTPVTITAGATTFSFGSVPSGTAYNVTATAQPASPTQNCVVANGTGTVTSANIANITVTCTTNTYTVGGTISGLTGTGLVLLNNLGDSLSVPAAATSFVFATPVASGALYSVSVGTSPTGQTCTVTSGSGTVGGANITNVVLTCTP
jgi:environmental stress-induced protein Ves